MYELQVNDPEFTLAPVIVHWALELNENNRTVMNNSKDDFIIDKFEGVKLPHQLLTKNFYRYTT